MTDLSHRHLPMLPLRPGDPHPARSAMTCQYRCGTACGRPSANPSGNHYLGDLVTAMLTRRSLLRAGVVAAGAGVLAGSAPAAGTASRAFPPVPPNRLDRVVVADGYQQAVLIRWGDPVLPGAPAFDVARQQWQAQLTQFGYNNDFVAVLPLPGRTDRALLVVNHEYTNESLMFPGFTGAAEMTVDQLRVAMAAHGMSVVEIERAAGSGRWRPVTRGARSRNRRITPLTTSFRMTGPAAGSPLLRTADDPAGRTVLGTFNNCSGGVTPWGTVLSGEENFEQYFVGGDQAPEELKQTLRRYGVETTARYSAGNRRWERADPRFDLARHPHEAHRFGWIVEVDPYDPRSTPRKHTALGRFKHEGAGIVLTRDRRVAAYLGDDEVFEYLYKFVSDRAMQPGDGPAAREHNRRLLESGTLYVARFAETSAAEIDGSGRLPSDGAFNGAGQWIPLIRGGESQVPGMSADEVLVFTRRAADLSGGTTLDRPEDVEPDPGTGRVYAALSNNRVRGVPGPPGVSEVSPRTTNRHGHLLEITEDGSDAAAETFTWNLPLVCGDPADPGTYFAGYDKSAVSPISCPDNVAFDRGGSIWIATDGNALGSNDGVFAMPLHGRERGHVRQFLSVPYGAEACGPFFTRDDRTLFTAVQHPGEVDGASFEHPASTWPDGDLPRPAVICVWHPDGRRIGR